MKKLKFPVAALATSMFLTACGGGGNAGGNPATGIIDLGGNPSVDNRPATDNTLSLEGVAADGYLVGATICLDLNSNLSCDSGEPSATTGAGGVFSIDATPSAKLIPIAWFWLLRHRQRPMKIPMLPLPVILY